MKYQLNFLYDYVFPNYILPNALMPEYTIVNYLNSQYSNRDRENCFSDPGASNITQAVFNKKFGDWPNSIRHNGTHLKAYVYSEDVDIVENALYIGKQTIKKYVYPIKLGPHIHEFIGINLRPGNKLNGEFFWKHMSEEALQDAQRGRAIIFLDYGQENFIEKHMYQALHEVLILSGIPKEQVILAFNTLNGKEVYETWFTPEERRLEVHNWAYVMCASSNFYFYNPDYSVGVERFKNTRNVQRKNHFLFKVRNIRNHRIALLFKMATDGLLALGDWSCLTKLNFNESMINHYKNLYQFDFNTDTIKQICESTPKTLQSEGNVQHGMVSAWTDKDFTAHIDSYFYICTETFVHGEHKSLTEKVFKPMANLQPFLFVAYPGALATLQNLGFKTFSPFIDESYDSEPDEGRRINMIYKEITRLCAMSKDEIHEWYWKMEDILLHNQNHLLNVRLNESTSMALIKYLYQKTSE
jgi:hypothetical protein